MVASWFRGGRASRRLAAKTETVLIPLLLLGVGFAQEPTFNSQSNLVLVPALVRDKGGGIVYGLTAQDFLITDEGVEQSIRMDEAADAKPVSIVLAIQTGGRAPYEFPRMQGLSSMLDPLLSEGRSEIAIVEFDSQVSLQQGFSSDTDLMASNLHALKPGDGGSAILDAVDFSVKLLSTVSPEREKVLLLISETRDHGSRSAKVQDVVKLIGDSSVIVYALPFSPALSNILDTERGTNLAEMHEGPDLLAPLRLAVEGARRNTPKTIASMSGGEYELFKSRKGFENLMNNFDNHLQSRYMLSFQPAYPHPGLHRVNVSLKHPNQEVILARTSYWAASASK
jgi:VWFA-related protein